MRLKAAAGLLALAIAPALFAQDIQVSPSNKTIEVTVTQTVKVDAEVAVVEIGYENFGATRDSTVDENVKAADKIIDAVEAGGILKAAIETTQLQIQPVEPDSDVPASERKERKYQADQEWNVHVPVAQAQNTVDLALNAGANEVDNVTWAVKDPGALEDKAIAAATAKARAEAAEILSGLGEKLGAVLYASNTMRRPKGWPVFAAESMGGMSKRTRQLHVHLFPKKVEEDATVHVIFAIQ